jgi:hypothetical protein
MGTSAVRTAGIDGEDLTYNHCLSLADVVYLCECGVHPSDMWGSQTSFITGDNSTFASDTGWWGGTDASITIPGDGYCHFLNTPSGKALNSVFNVIQKAKFIVTTSSYIKGVLRIYVNGIYAEGIASDTTYTLTLTNVYKLSFIANTETSINFTNVLLYPLGCTGLWTGFQPPPGQVLDASSNKNHALQPATGSSLTQPKYDFTFKATIEWSASNTARHINVGNVDQAVLTSKSYITSIISKVTVSTSVQNIEIGDGSDVDRYVASVAPSGTQDHTLVNNINDGTNLKLVVTPAGSATMTIEFTVLGIILE